MRPSQQRQTLAREGEKLAVPTHQYALVNVHPYNPHPRLMWGLATNGNICSFYW